MARGLRVDAPGMLHHVTFRGVDGCPIFVDDTDRHGLLRRVDRLFVELGFACFAWVFMLNHVHFVLQTGSIGLDRLMARLGTGYAMYFNRRHGRTGHLWQDRYWSRPLEEDIEVVAAYVHANPLRARLIREEEHGQYPWSGHGGAIGVRARLAFERTSARVPEVEPRRGLEARPTVAGDGLENLIARVCLRSGIAVSEVLSNRRTRGVADVRAEIARLAVHEGHRRSAEVARALGLSDSAVSRLLLRPQS